MSYTWNTRQSCIPNSETLVSTLIISFFELLFHSKCFLSSHSKCFLSLNRQRDRDRDNDPSLQIVTPHYEPEKESLIITPYREASQKPWFNLFQFCEYVSSWKKKTTLTQSKEK